MRPLTPPTRRVLAGTVAVVAVAGVLTVAARGGAATPPPETTASFGVTADAYVRADAPTANFGARFDDQVSSQPDARTYVSVDVSGLSGPVVSASLQFTSYSGAAEGVDVARTSDDWSESSITYDTAPTPGAPVGHSGPLTSFGSVRVDVSSVVTGDGSYSFALSSSRTSGVSHLGSRESGTPPRLVVVTAPAGTTPTPSDTATASAPAPSTSAPAPTDPVPTTSAPTSTGVPGLDHVVVVVMENKSYGDVIGNAAAPYTNELARTGAVFSHSYALTHPSQPNYLGLFSGSTQGVTDDSCPHSFAGPDLASTLADRSRSFRAYSEDLPSVGWTGCSTGSYARKHAPWTDFTDVPADAGRPFSEFPSTFSSLPAVSFVIPNLVDDMHNAPVSVGDAWLGAHLGAYATWARTHNSALVVTFDEDDNSADNQIPTVIVGDHVRPGVYPERIDHYRVLRTVEDAFDAAPVGASASAAPITDIWS